MSEEVEGIAVPAEVGPWRAWEKVERNSAMEMVRYRGQRMASEPVGVQLFGAPGGGSMPKAWHTSGSDSEVGSQGVRIRERTYKNPPRSSSKL